MRKFILISMILLLAGSSAFAFDFLSHPDPIKKGSLMISPTFNFGLYGYGGLGFYSGYGGGGRVILGGTVSIEYALPINVGLVVGGEIGIAVNPGKKTWGYTPIAIPIMGKISWHPNFEVKGLDPYTVFKIGPTIGFYAGGGSGSGSGKAGGGVSYGWDVGCRYFFNDAIGIFGELGYDGYYFRTGPSGYRYFNHMHKFLSIGVTFLI